MLDDHDQDAFQRGSLKMADLGDSTFQTHQLKELLDISDVLAKDNVQVTIIDSPEHEGVLWYRMKLVRCNVMYSRARAKMLKEGSQYVVAMGEKVLLRAMKGIYPIVSYMLTPYTYAILKKQFGKELPELLGRAPVYLTTAEMVNTILGMAINKVQQGACLVDMVPTSIQDVLKGDMESPCLIFDDVRSADNIGVLLRSAFSFGVKSCLMSDTSIAALNARSARVSVGALFQFKVYSAPNMSEGIKVLSSHGIHTLGTSPRGESVVSPHPTRKWALLIGNEFEGASDSNLSACDTKVKIPQVAGDSLSISHATVICMYELSRSFLEDANWTVDPD